MSIKRHDAAVLEKLPGNYPKLFYLYNCQSLTGLVAGGWCLVALFSGRKVSGVIFQFPIVSPLLSPGPASAASWKWAAVDNISGRYSEGKIIWTLPPITLLPELRWFFVSWPWRWFVSVFANMKLLMTLASLCDKIFFGYLQYFYCSIILFSWVCCVVRHTTRSDQSSIHQWPALTSSPSRPIDCQIETNGSDTTRKHEKTKLPSYKY